MKQTNLKSGINFSSLSIEELESMLNEAVENEDYELASQIRDEINKENKLHILYGTKIETHHHEFSPILYLGFMAYYYR